MSENEKWARYVLKTIREIGIDGVKSQEMFKNDLKTGLEKSHLTQDEVDLAQTEYEKSQSTDILGMIKTFGLDDVKDDKKYRMCLEYGLKKHYFTKDDVRAADIEYRRNMATNALDEIQYSGLDFVRSSEEHGGHLEYGLKKGIFSEDDLLRKQKIYEISQK